MQTTFNNLSRNGFFSFIRFCWFGFCSGSSHAGTYFGTHFIMGGERFDTPQPEAYLFGENGDLNFLGSRPTAVNAIATELACVANWLNRNFLQFSFFTVPVSTATSKRTDQNAQEFNQYSKGVGTFRESIGKCLENNGQQRNRHIESI